MLDGSRRVAGVGEYDVHGMVNRSRVAAATARPYGTNLDVTLLAMQQPQDAGVKVDLRAHFEKLETEVGSDGGLADYAELRDGTSSSQLAGPYTGNLGPFWTSWVSPTGDTVNLKFRSDGEVCCGFGYCGPWCAAQGPSVDRWEYRKYQSTATWFWVPLRLAGQYEDAETELHENWNRFYEPPSGRYLSPEPLLQSPRYVKRMAKRGMSVPTYAYAANNPLRYTDADGRALRVNPFMQWLYGDEVVAELQRVIDRVNSPECRCAMTSGSGYEKAPWDDADVWLGVDEVIGLDALSIPSLVGPGVIWLDPDTYAEGVDAMANSVGHESGHFRFPYWGHFWNEQERFTTPTNHCGYEVGGDFCKCDR